MLIILCVMMAICTLSEAWVMPYIRAFLWCALCPFLMTMVDLPEGDSDG
jgi:hypothetical protein